MATDKTLVIATAKHPNRPQGEEYLLTTALVGELITRGFVRLPGGKEVVIADDRILPRAVKVIKPRAVKKK